MRRVKLNDRVTFPLYLDLNPIIHGKRAPSQKPKHEEYEDDEDEDEEDEEEQREEKEKGRAEDQDDEPRRQPRGEWMLISFLSFYNS